MSDQTYKMADDFSNAVKTLGFNIGALEKPKAPRKPFVVLKFNGTGGNGPVPVGLEIELTARFGPSIFIPKDDGKAADGKAKEEPKKNPTINFESSENPELARISEEVRSVLEAQLKAGAAEKHTSIPNGFSYGGASLQGICKIPDRNFASQKTIDAGPRMTCSTNDFTKYGIIENRKIRYVGWQEIQDIHKKFNVGRYFASINLNRLSHATNDMDDKVFAKYGFRISLQTLFFSVDETAKIAGNKDGGTGLFSKYGVNQAPETSEPTKRKAPEPAESTEDGNAGNAAEDSGEPPAKRAKVSSDHTTAPAPVTDVKQDETEEEADEDVASD